MRPRCASPAGRPVGPILQHYAFGVVCAVAFINYVDRQIISVLLEAIKRDFGASDAQMGMVSGLAFAAVYTIAGIFLARLADVGPRVPLIAASLALWSGMTIICGFAKNYIWLVFGRMGVAAGEAGIFAGGWISDHIGQKCGGQLIS